MVSIGPDPLHSNPPSSAKIDGFGFPSQPPNEAVKSLSYSSYIGTLIQNFTIASRSPCHPPLPDHRDFILGFGLLVFTSLGHPFSRPSPKWKAFILLSMGKSGNRGRKGRTYLNRTNKPTILFFPHHHGKEPFTKRTRTCGTHE